jgi:hypothetical protein
MTMFFPDHDEVIGDQVVKRLSDSPVDGCPVLQRADYTTLKEVTGSPVGPGSTVIPPRATRTGLGRLLSENKPAHPQKAA